MIGTVIRAIKALAAAACWGCVLAGGALASGAQTAGELAGVVRDATGAVVPGVTVTVTGTTLSAPVAIKTICAGSPSVSRPASTA